MTKKVTKEEKVMMDGMEAVKDTKKEKKKSLSFQEIYNGREFNIIVKENPLKTKEELRSAVRTFEQIQEFRIGAGNRQFQLDKEEEEKKEGKKQKKENKNISFSYVNAGLKDIEDTIKIWLEKYVQNDPIGRWLDQGVKGLGPILSASLLSYIDIEKCQTAGAIWRYAGIEKHRAPRKRGVKIDYNPKFRVVCWKIGEQFVKLSGYEKEMVLDPKTGKKVPKLDENGNEILILDKDGKPIFKNPDAYYGVLYRRKLEECIEKNEKGGYAELAALTLSEKNFEKETSSKKLYESGKLPMSHVMAIAKRWTVKIFLSHLFTLWYEHHHGEQPPRPFAEAILGHCHIIAPPNRNLVFDKGK